MNGGRGGAVAGAETRSWTYHLVLPMAQASGFELRIAHVRFMMVQMALGQVSPQILRFSPVLVVPPMLSWSVTNIAFLAAS